VADHLGIDALAAWMAGRQEGDRHRGLFWAACRAAEDGLEPGPLIGAAEAVGLSQDDAERTIASAARTIKKAREEHGKLDPE
jgi:hypothetical protein